MEFGSKMCGDGGDGEGKPAVLSSACQGAEVMGEGWEGCVVPVLAPQGQLQRLLVD